MIDALSIERFQDLVASYGANLERWPADQRSSAVHILVDSEAARAVWRDAADLDTDLDSVPGLDISADLAERVMSIADTPMKQANATLLGALRHTAPYAAAAAIALVVGLSVPSPFRDAAGTALQNELAVIDPIVSDENDDGLTTLALVDVRTFADDEADSDDALSGVIVLAGIPLL